MHFKHRVIRKNNRGNIVGKFNGIFVKKIGSTEITAMTLEIIAGHNNM